MVHITIVTLAYNSPLPKPLYCPQPRTSVSKKMTPEFLEAVEMSRWKAAKMSNNMYWGMGNRPPYTSRHLDHHSKVHLCRQSSASSPPMPLSSTDLFNSYPVPDVSSNTSRTKSVNDYKHDRHIPANFNSKDSERDRRKSRDGNVNDDRRTRQRSRDWENKDDLSSPSRFRLLDRESHSSVFSCDSPDRSDSEKPTILGTNEKSQLTFKNQSFKPNGIRQSGTAALSMGAAQFAPAIAMSLPYRPVSLNSSSGLKQTNKDKDPDDLVAMGKNWLTSQSKNDKSSIGSATNNTNSTLSGLPKRLSSRPMQSIFSGTKQSKSKEQKYPDPNVGAPSSFIQRLNELSAVEIETIRWEKARKLKRKPKQDS